jgi:glyoxylase-like metal-dependent hydrolase (beta-lactamase superfamily II)
MGEHLYGGDPHDTPMPMDYFVWAAVSDEHTVVVDTGFTPEVAARRGRDHLRCPTEGLREIGVDCERVSCVVLTRLHYDHAGNLKKFPPPRSWCRKRRWPSGPAATRAGSTSDTPWR